MSLDEKDYPKYLKKAYYIKFNKKLNLNHPKDINEKIQWLKIYDNKPIKTTLTDKLLVRDWVKDKIGEEYLKPVLWVGNNFDDIPFDTLPNSFIIKCNHGCKWQFVVKEKDKFLQIKKIQDLTKMQIQNWLQESFFGWSDFETQYRNIIPKILIEPLLIENPEDFPCEIEVWCFNGKPKIIQQCKNIPNSKNRQIITFDENLNNIDLKFFENDEVLFDKPNEFIKQAIELSSKLAENFKLVRVDWHIFNNRLYFGEMTFTPQSGFIIFSEKYKDYYNKLGKMLNLKGT